MRSLLFLEYTSCTRDLAWTTRTIKHFLLLVRTARADYVNNGIVGDIEIFDQDGALSREYLLARGYCCGNGCRNCPYIPRHGGLDAAAPVASSEESASGEYHADR